MRPRNISSPKSWALTPIRWLFALFSLKEAQIKSTYSRRPLLHWLKNIKDLRLEPRMGKEDIFWPSWSDISETSAWDITSSLNHLKHRFLGKMSRRCAPQLTVELQPNAKSTESKENLSCPQELPKYIAIHVGLWHGSCCLCLLWLWNSRPRRPSPHLHLGRRCSKRRDPKARWQYLPSSRCWQAEEKVYAP